MDASLAAGIKDLAVYLYNNSSASVSRGYSIKYGGSAVQDNYDLTGAEHLYSYRGETYYRSELMSVTISGMAANMNAVVTVNNGYVSNGNSGN